MEINVKIPRSHFFIYSPGLKYSIAFISNQEILLDLAVFALQEQPEDNLMVAISRSWYNGSYTMAAKPMKSLQIALYN